MTGPSLTPRSEPPTLGQVLHAARVEHNPPSERPRGVPPWEERAQWQRDLDEKMAAAVEAEVRRRVAADFRRLAGDLTRHPLVSPGVPGIEREARRDTWLAAAVVAVHGLAPKERDDEKEASP